MDQSDLSAPSNSSFSTCVSALNNCVLHGAKFLPCSLESAPRNICGGHYHERFKKFEPKIFVAVPAVSSLFAQLFAVAILNFSCILRTAIKVHAFCEQRSI